MLKYFVTSTAVLSIFASCVSFTLAGSSVPVNAPLSSGVQSVADFASHFAANMDEMFTELGFTLLDDLQSTQEFAQRFHAQSDEMFASLGYVLLADAEIFSPASSSIVQVASSIRDDFVQTVGLLDQYARNDYPEIALAAQIVPARTQTAFAKTEVETELEQQIDPTQYDGLTLGLLVRATIEKFLTGSTAPHTASTTQKVTKQVAGSSITTTQSKDDTR